jgi:hypothetical protein
MNPHASVEFVCDSPKLNMFYVLSKDKVCSPFLFTEQTITGKMY